MGPRLSFAVLTVGATLSAFGCSTSASENVATNAGTSADNLVVGDVGLANDVTVFDDHLEVPYRGHEALASTLTAGKILSAAPSATKSGNPSGFLRAVSGVRQSGQTLVIDTTQAKLTDAIVDGTLHSDSLDFSGISGSSATSSLRVLNTSAGGSGGAGAGSSSLGQTLENDFYGDLVLFQNESGELSSHKFNLTEQVKVAEGTLSFTPTFQHDVKIANHSLESLAMKLGGALKVHALLDVKVTADVDLQWDTWHGAPTKKSVRILKVPRIGLPVQMVGVLPVYESLDLGVDLGCDFTFQGPIETQVGIDIDLEAAIGAAYQNGQWSNTSQSPQIKLAPIFKMTAQGQLTMQCYVQPTAQLLFYSVAGPNVQFGPYLEVDTQFGAANDFRYAAYPGFNGAIGGDFQLFERDLAFGQFTVYQCQAPKPWISSKVLPVEDKDNAKSPACGFFPDMSSSGN